jgi:hypothetical protein
MLSDDKVLESVRRMRALIRIGRDRISKHSPVWAVFLAGETFHALTETLDELETEAGGGAKDADLQSFRRAG